MGKCSAVMLSGHKPQVADAVIEAMTQSLISTGTYLLGFFWVESRQVSSLSTEGDREALGKNSNGPP